MNRLVIAAFLLAVASAAQAGGDPAAGKQKAAQVCAACHGAQGNKPLVPENPILAGQWPDYLVKALEDYKSGKRANPVMKGFASTLSQQDMEDLAAWFSSQPSVLHSER
ncbi:MAG: c-type cytochrome [Burkholderiales bacterium]